MKAMVLQQAGGVENLIKTDIPVPGVSAQEVLVKVNSISINPVDVFVRANENALRYVLQLEADEQPVILGWDISGVVVQAGSAVRKFRTGDEVFGMVNFMGHGRAYAGYVAAPESHLALKPQNIPHQEAAAATLAALTAYQSLITYANVKPGEKVIIHAAAGGVGHYAVQIAKHLGAHVIGLASGENKHFVLGLGADEFIDYKTQVFEELVKDADVIVDSVNDPAHIERSLNALRPGGRLISLLTFFSDEFNLKLKEKNVSGHRLVVSSDGDQMAEIAAWLEKGVLISHVSGAFSFDELPEAHLRIETRKTRGKIVVNL
ncbi:MAG: NADP-dependent oxidoreductase [Sphingobacteriales bacterium]|nr:NADP-dependent oxidoreductase [Sphingobacteriales bacterium]